MTEPEPTLLPISALQHLLYCPRQCALIHNEQLWAENVFTTEGNIVHERAHAGKPERRPKIRIERAVPVRSMRLGLIGVCDVVEFHPDGRVLPVEYKRGRSKFHDADRLQLAAQAVCLEEQLNRPIGSAAIFYAQTRRREEVPIDDTLRALLDEKTAELHSLLDIGHTPPADYNRRKCDNCSLIHLCLPKAVGRRSVPAFNTDQLASALAADGPPADLNERATP